MNHDATHCADYTEGKCPESCYRGQLTKELAERRKEFSGIPISYASFAGTSECARSYKPVTDEMRMLDQLQDMLAACEKHPENMPTMRSFLMVARAVYWLLERRVRSNGKAN